MQKTITVKGTGKLEARPDHIIISMTTHAEDPEYALAVAAAAGQLEKIGEALNAVGFGKESLKTSGFNVRAQYENMEISGKWVNRFKGYIVSHILKLEFGFDTNRLADALAAISGSSVYPQLSIAFTVKDVNAVKDELLRLATEDAKHNAEVLCAASGCHLGELIGISYNSGENGFSSPTMYSMSENLRGVSPASVSIVPEDISITEDAVFTWVIN